MDVQGTVRGSQIELERPLPDLEGRRVRVQLEAVDESDTELSSEDQREAWEQWISTGPQGPIDDEQESTWP